MLWRFMDTPLKRNLHFCARPMPAECSYKLYEGQALL
jgi:hypothetical protein